MIVGGRLLDITSDGYERFLKIEFDNGSVLWAYGVEPSEYLEIEEDTKILTVGEKYDFKISMEWVNEYEVIYGQPQIVEQPIKNSPHIIAQGFVKEIIDEYSAICDFETLKGVLVEFEIKIKGINLGDQIRFSGSLRVERI